MRYSCSRRHLLKTGAAALLAGSACQSGPPAGSGEISDRGPGREASWGPGPDRNLVRDLTPGDTPIRFADNLRPSADDDIPAAVKALRDTGYTSCVTGPDPWLDLSDSRIREITDALRTHDVTVFEVGGYRNLLHTDEAVRKENLAYIARCIEAADRIGCPLVGTISGSRNPEGNRWGDNYAPHPDNWTIETWRMLVDGIHQILDDTAGMRAVIGMEAQVTTNIDGPLAHKRLMEDVGDPRLKVNLDPTNMVSFETYFHTTALINECFDMLGEDIMGCHAKDSYILPHEQTVHVQEVCPGRGVLDYETYLVRLSRMEHPRSLLPEHIPNDQYAEAKEFIERTAARLGVTIYGQA